jgi:hypothetical protein
MLKELQARPADQVIPSHFPNGEIQDRAKHLARDKVFSIVFVVLLDQRSEEPQCRWYLLQY